MVVERAPRIRDVAAHAGVSTATVSRALGEPGSVRPALRARVLEAVKALGYTPNAAARSLRAGRTRTILVLTRKRWSAPFFSEILRGIDEELAHAGYSMILGNFDLEEGRGDGREAAIVDMMFSGHIDGAIVLAGIVASAGGRTMLDAALPLVSICAAVDGMGAVVTDEARSIRTLACHLAGHGHADFLYVSGPPDNRNETTRRAAMKAFVAGNAGLRLRVAEGDFSMESGAAAAAGFLALDPRPTAVVCCSDEMAIGFMKAVQEAGLSVPGEVSVTGFDGIEFADYCVPTLTTIRQPRFEIGRTGARLLLSILDGKEAAAGPIVLANELRIAGSTGAPAAGHGAPGTSSSSISVPKPSFG